MRLTLGDIRNNFRIAEALNIPPNDSRLVTFINEATQRLMHRGKWWGTVAKYSMYATEGTVTLPKQVAVIEKVALSNQVVPVRDFWYEFLENGWGTRADDSGTVEGLFKGRYPIFSDIVPTDKKVICQCDFSSDVDTVTTRKRVLILGYDDDNNWIRTEQDGVISDGEVISLAQTPGTMSTKKYSVVTDIQVMDDLDGQWWLYEYNTTDATQRMIGHYQYDETRPSYARYFFPSIGTTTTLLECLVKLEFVPVKQDSDYCLIGNPGALKKMAMAIKAEEENRFQDAAVLEAQAIQLLNAELDHYLGSGRTIGINVVGSSIGSNQPIEAFL